VAVLELASKWQGMLDRREVLENAERVDTLPVAVGRTTEAPGSTFVEGCRTMVRARDSHLNLEGRRLPLASTFDSPPLRAPPSCPSSRLSPTSRS
jgi:hypothetical protein